MSDFVLVTHTLWQEAPRIRHQVARLLADAGHRVLFVERAVHLLASPLAPPREVAPGILAVRTRRLMHHQLRPVAPLDWVNDRVAARSLLAAVRSGGIASDATIVNFMHDGAFLRRVFPNQRILTLIHDDFEAQVRLPGFGHATRNLQATCQASDRVLAVSTPLLRRLSAWCTPELFLPWASRPYRAPRVGAEDRDTLLFWGHVDIGLDTDRIRSISERLRQAHPSLRILIVGPTQVPERRAMTVRRIEDLPNVRIQDARLLEELPLDRVLAALIPYRRKGDVDATELPNKTLPLLSCGLPILKTGLPNMVQAPFIHAVDTDAELDQAIQACRTQFDAWQPMIRHFLDAHDAASRLAALVSDPAR